MLNAPDVKIASAPEPRGSFGIIGRALYGSRLARILVAAAVAGILLMLVGHVAASTKQLRVGSKTFTLQVANTDRSIAKGLGGRDSLPTDQGMLFVFQNSGTKCFWMKDMRFPIDMVWLNSNKQVVHVQPDVSPATYPEQFCPHESARYVIELDAGTTQHTGIHDGQTLNF